MDNATRPPAMGGGIHWQGDRSALICGDFLLIPDLPQVDMIFSDPPWNQAILNKFYTLAGKKNTTSFYAFIEASLHKMLALCPQGNIILEFGMQAGGLARAILQDAGINLRAEGSYVYGNDTPYGIQVWNQVDSSPIQLPVIPRTQRLANLYAVEQAVFRNLAEPGHTCLDPFCGECYNLEIAASHGMQFIGVELIPTKLDRGLKRMRRYQPVYLSV